MTVESVQLTVINKIDRGDRYETQSEEQHELTAENIKYSVKVDTSKNSPSECADIIVDALF